MDILRIATAGSVDDGKSTLIGRLLYETKSITQDKIEALEAASKRKGLDFVDLSLLTDGLIAEREQGITIDVAHIYFNTARRKYIIADTPGHIEYTRNMVTGASNAQVSIILVDARLGLSEQTKRHFYIAQLLRIPEVIVAVNKMDLVGYDENVFQQIIADFKKTCDQIGFDGQQVRFIPLSSLYGENMVVTSDKMPWYQGDSLLDILESLPPQGDLYYHKPARMGVQWVIRPKTDAYHDYRGYAGRISSGVFKSGDTVISLPSGQESTIDRIEKFGEDISQAQVGDSVVITLTSDIDVSRGNMLVKKEEDLPWQTKQMTAEICWLDHQPLVPGKTYLIQHGINRQKSKIISLNSLLEMPSLVRKDSPNQLALNEIGQVQLKLGNPVFVDTYANNPRNGAFILIDEQSNSTVGVGFVEAGI